MAVIVDIDHEAGNFSEYTSSVTDGGDLSVTAAAALAGSNYGLQCVIDDLNPIYAYLLLGAAVTTGVLRYRFYADPNSMTRPLDTGNTVVIVANASSQPVSFASMYRLLAGEFGFYVVCVDDAGNDHNSGIVPVTDGEHRIEVHTVRATTSTSADGYTEFWVDGVYGYKTELVDNYDRMGAYQLFIVGAPSGIDAGTSGTYYVDQLVANNDGSEIGPVSSSTSKSVSDAGTGSDVLNSVSVIFSLSDTGAGADILPGPLAEFSLSDLGSGLEVPGIAAALTVNDSGAGADQPAIAVIFTLTDTGSGVDVASILSDIIKSVTDLAAATDAIGSIVVSTSLSDSGNSSDVIALSVSLGISDTATAVELISVLQDVLIAVADQALTSDTISSVSVSVPVSDTGLGLELPQIASVILLTDFGQGVDVAIQFDTAVKIVRIVFTIDRRTVDFALARYGMDFSLSQRAVAFVLSQ